MNDVIEIDFDPDFDYDEDGNSIQRTVKIEDSDSRDDGSEVDTDKNQYNLLIENVNGGEENNFLT